MNNNGLTRVIALVPLRNPIPKRKPILTGCPEDTVQLGQFFLDIINQDTKGPNITPLDKDKKGVSKLHHGFQILFENVAVPARYKAFMVSKFGKEIPVFNLVLNAGVGGTNGYRLYAVWGAIVIGDKTFKFDINHDHHDLTPAQIFLLMENRYKIGIGCECPSRLSATSLARFFHVK